MTQQEEDQLRRLYIAFGMAAHTAQLVEKELALALLLPIHAEAKRHPTREEIEKTVEEVNRLPFGILVKRLKRFSAITPDEERYLDEALQKRNYLIHHFVDFYGADMCIGATREKMIGELTEIQSFLHPLYKKYSRLSFESFRAWGMTDEQIQARIDQLEAEFDAKLRESI
jgi:hypothetical protein